MGEHREGGGELRQHKGPKGEEDERGGGASDVGHDRREEDEGGRKHSQL